jgi:hypothetical protein
MKIFHLFAVSALILSFSGKPAPEESKIPSPTKDSSLEKKETDGFIPRIPDQRLVW